MRSILHKQPPDLEYATDLAKLRKQLLFMGAHVEEMIGHAVRALVQRDSELASKTIDRDAEVDRLEVEIDELCLGVLARRQPDPADLRFVATGLKLVTDLERIADLGVNICERVLELNLEPASKHYAALTQMADAARAMVREALDAFVQRDAELAERVIARDSEVDAHYAEIFRALLSDMTADPRDIYRSTRVQSVAKYLERIGDHATNLAEMVVFMVRGKDIRHPGTRPASVAGRRQPSSG